MTVTVFNAYNQFYLDRSSLHSFLSIVSSDASLPNVCNEEDYGEHDT